MTHTSTLLPYRYGSSSGAQGDPSDMHKPQNLACALLRGEADNTRSGTPLQLFHVARYDPNVAEHDHSTGITKQKST